MDLIDRRAKTVNHLSILIADALYSMEAQRHFPASNADQMDAIIDFEKTRVAVLRRIREQFENEMARPMERE